MHKSIREKEKRADALRCKGYGITRQELSHILKKNHCYKMMFDVRLSFQLSGALPLLSGPIGELSNWAREERQEHIMWQPCRGIMASLERNVAWVED